MLRISRRSLALAVVAVALVMTAMVPVTSATNPGRNGRIAFQAQTDEGLEIFTMRPDGHDLRQITHVDGDATVPDWAPNGSRIVSSRAIDSAAHCEKKK